MTLYEIVKSEKGVIESDVQNKITKEALRALIDFEPKITKMGVSDTGIFLADMIEYVESLGNMEWRLAEAKIDNDMDRAIAAFKLRRNFELDFGLIDIQEILNLYLTRVIWGTEYERVTNEDELNAGLLTMYRIVFKKGEVNGKK